MIAASLSEQVQNLQPSIIFLDSMYYITDLSSKYSTEAGEILKSVVKIKEFENNRASSHLIFAVYYLKWLYTVSIGVLNEDWAQFRVGEI